MVATKGYEIPVCLACVQTSSLPQKKISSPDFFLRQVGRLYTGYGMSRNARVGENGQHRQSLGKNSNEMAKGRFESGDFDENGDFDKNGKGTLLRVTILVKMAYLEKIRGSLPSLSRKSKKMERGPLGKRGILPKLTSPKFKQKLK